MSGVGGPIRGGVALPRPPEAEALLERALDALHGDLACLVEVSSVLVELPASGELVPDMDRLDDVTLAKFGDLIGLVIDIEDHLGLAHAVFSTKASPYWLRQVIRRGRQLRERTS